MNPSEEKEADPAGATPVRRMGHLASSYGETRLVLLAVDPYMGHVYWDMSPGDLEKAKSARAMLRFHEITGVLERTHAAPSFEVEIDLDERKAYVRLPSPAKSYRADLGFRTEVGRFVEIARSNTVEAPPGGPSMKRVDRYRLIAGEYEQGPHDRHQVQREAPSPQAERGAGPPFPTEASATSSPPSEGVEPEGAEDASLGLPLKRRETEAVSQVGAGSPQASRPSSETPAPGQVDAGPEQVAAPPIDAAELTRKRLAALYHGRAWKKPPSSQHAPPAQDKARSRDPEHQETKDLDLTALSERMFIAGLSSG